MLTSQNEIKSSKIYIYINNNIIDSTSFRFFGGLNFLTWQFLELAGNTVIEIHTALIYIKIETKI